MFRTTQCSTGEYRKIQLIGHAGRCQYRHALSVDKANVEVLISTSCRFKLNFFFQSILIVRALPEHCADDLEFVSQKLVCASVQFGSQHNVENSRGQEHERKASQRIGRHESKP